MVTSEAAVKVPVCEARGLESYSCSNWKHAFYIDYCNQTISMSLEHFSPISPPRFFLPKLSEIKPSLTAKDFICAAATTTTS